MRRLAGALALFLATAAAARADDDPPARLSLSTESDGAAWLRPGFRLQLGLAYGRLVGLDGAPDGRLVGPLLRAGLRLDESWSLLGSFEYLAASADGGLSGLRYAGTIEPTFHATPNLSVALGIGFGGIVEGRNTGRVNPDPQPGTLESSYTFPDARTPLPSCDGVGVTGIAHVDWMFVLGPRSSTGLSLEALGQWTGCESSTGRVEPDTARPIVRRQFWPHLGVTLAWLVAWR